jgi:hypothetical protein
MRELKSGKLAGSRFKKNNGLLVSNHILILLFYWAFFCFNNAGIFARKVGEANTTAPAPAPPL